MYKRPGQVVTPVTPRIIPIQSELLAHIPMSWLQKHYWTFPRFLLRKKSSFNF